MLLTKTLLDCMEAVADDTAEKLKEFKERFTSLASGKNSQSSGSHGGGKTLGSLGSAAPTATVQDLVCLKTLREFHLKVQTDVTEKADYKSLRADLVDKLAPLKDVMAAFKKRVAAVDTRKAAWKNVEDQKFGSVAAPTAFSIT